MSGEVDSLFLLEEVDGRLFFGEVGGVFLPGEGDDLFLSGEVGGASDDMGRRSMILIRAKGPFRSGSHVGAMYSSSTWRLVVCPLVIIFGFLLPFLLGGEMATILLSLVDPMVGNRSHKVLKVANMELEPARPILGGALGGRPDPERKVMRLTDLVWDKGAASEIVRLQLNADQFILGNPLGRPGNYQREWARDPTRIGDV